MKSRLVSLLAVAAALVLILSGCTQAAPAPTPTKAPAAPAPTKAAEPTKPAAAPTKPAEPTKAPAAQPTAVPAARVDFPQKGKTITIMVPWAAGGNTDVYTRMVASYMEKEMGVPVQVVNKAGASGQVGWTEVALAKPDGYMLTTVSVAAISSTYLDPERKAVYSRKSFQALGNHGNQPTVMSVQADSPFKSAKDVVDAAKANPEKVKYGIGGWLAPPHVGVAKLEIAAGVRFAIVEFTGGAPALAALLGGHTDVGANSLPEVTQAARANQLRVLGILGPGENKLLPGVKSMESQGYKVQSLGNQGIAGPAGMAPEVVNILDSTLKKISQLAEFKQKMDDLGYDPGYMGPAEFSKFWDDFDKEMPALIEHAKKGKA